MGLIINKNTVFEKSTVTDWKSKSVLIVDDFRDFRFIVRNMLQSFGVTSIDQASNGESAIAKIAEKKYDIILCDYNLGEGKDGQQVLEEGRHRGFITPSSVFIMITAENTTSMVLGAVEYLPDDYLVKPLTHDVVLSRIEKLLQKKAKFAHVQKALDRKAYQEAMDQCDQGIMANPSNPYDFLKIKAEVLVTIGQYDKARTLYEDVLKQRTILWALMGVGKIHYFVAEYDKARDVFQSVITKNNMLMEAYDWLAKTFGKLDMTQDAQQTLLAATTLSPKVILRQRALGEVAYKNSDFDIAARSFRSAITFGKNSCFKSPSEYVGLAKVLIDSKSGDEALKVVSETKKEFKDNADALVQSSAVESRAYLSLGDTKRASKAAEEGSRYCADAADTISLQTAMDLAKAHFSLGSVDAGTKLMQDVIKNNHDDERVMQEVRNIFKDANMPDEGTKLISDISREMVLLNNKGVDLLDEGKLDEAVAYFEKAAASLPNNKIINANAAYGMVLYMQKNGKDDALIKKTQFYLDRVRDIDPHYKMYLTTLSLLQHL